MGILPLGLHLWRRVTEANGIPLTGRKRLDFDSQQSSSTSVNPPRAQQFPTWTTDEETLLLEFLARKRSEGNFSQWPSFGNKSLWEDAGKYVTENSTNQPPSCERTGKLYI